MKQTVFILLIIFLLSCSKKELISTESLIIPEQWEKFIGNYRVYDTIGSYMFDINISHYIGISATSGNPLDSMLIQNFADTFDLRFQFSNSPLGNYLNIGFNDSVVDYNNKAWFVGSLFDDTNTVAKENTLVNDTMIMYFELDNILHYIPQAQPYYRCECKHVAVKQ
jgi:hypothetical protein